MKILVISQHIFPIQTPRANRTTELIKELARLGNEVTVYAVLGKYNYAPFEKEFNIKVKNIPIKFQKKPYTSDGYESRAFIDKTLGRLFGKLLEFPNIEFMYNIPLIIQKEQKADLLISIADPHHIHWGCARAKLISPEKFPKKWIADCGDPFLADIKNKYHYKYYIKYEKLFCSLCDYITVPIQEATEAYFPEFRNKIKVIPQGFLFELPLEMDPTINNKILTFAYAGTFYKDIRNPSVLFDYLSSVNKNFKFIIFTGYKDLALPYKNILKNKLELRDPIERNELIKVLKKMDFLINIENHNSPNQIPSKLIDYAIANRPILSINISNFDIKMIDEFLSGNYSRAYKVKDLAQYQIANVTKKMLALVND